MGDTRLRSRSCDSGEVRLQLWSDLHLEVFADQGPPSHDVYVAAAPYIFLAGDIGTPGSDAYVVLLATIAGAHERVFIVTGNHEYHGTSIAAADEAMRTMCLVHPNVVFLDGTKTFDLADGKHRVIGTTLWSHVTDDQRSDVECFIPDHRRIDAWDVDKNNASHAKAVAFLRSEISRATVDDMRLIVLTHHAPLTSGTCKPQSRGSVLSSAFQTDLMYMMGPPIAMWCFGHTHHCSNQVVAGTRIVSNPRGYKGEGTTFDMMKVVVVEGVDRFIFGFDYSGRK